MSTTDGYFQFPICGLAYGENETDRAGAIISYGIVSTGLKLWADLDDEEKTQRRDGASVVEKPKDFAEHRDDHMAVWIGAKAIGCTLHRMGATIQAYNELTEFRRCYELKHGTDVSVRIKRDVVFEVRDKTGMPYDEFAFLCAIYSCIGANHGPVRIVRESMKARSMGYKSAKILGAELHNRKDGRKIPTEWQVRSTVDKLHALKWFSRCHPSRRQTYYSNKLSDDELREQVLKRKTYLAEFKARQRGKDAALAESIKARTSTTIIEPEPSTIIGTPPEPAKLPPEDHQGPSNVPPLAIHYNKNPSNRNSPQRNPEKETLSIPSRELSDSDSEGEPVGGKEPEPETPPTFEAMRSLAPKPTTTTWPKGMFTKLAFDAIDNKPK